MGANFSRIKIWITEILTSSDLNAEFNNILNNFTAPGMDDYSTNATQMQSVVDPGEVGSENLPTSLAGELERLRFEIKYIKSLLKSTTPQWYSGVSPPYDSALWMKLVSPYVRFTGTEGSAKDFKYGEEAGLINLWVNTGTESVPVWSLILSIDNTGSLLAGIVPLARLGSDTMLQGRVPVTRVMRSSASSKNASNITLTTDTFITGISIAVVKAGDIVDVEAQFLMDSMSAGPFGAKVLADTGNTAAWLFNEQRSEIQARFHHDITSMSDPEGFTMSGKIIVTADGVLALKLVGTGSTARANNCSLYALVWAGSA